MRRSAVATWMTSTLACVLLAACSTSVAGSGTGTAEPPPSAPRSFPAPRPPDSNLTVQCFAEATCSVRGDQGFATGHIDAVSAGEDSLIVSWSVDGVPRAEHLYDITFTSPTLLDCVPLAVDVVCLVQTSQGAHHTSAAVFSVNASGLTDIKSFDAYGVFLLQPLDEKQLLLWSWTSTAVLGEPEPYGEAWQTWVVTAASMELTGCGPTRTDGKASGPTPEEPLTLPCPDGSGPGG